MMKIQKSLLVLAFAAFSMNSVAQDFAGTSYDDRIAYSNNDNEDSIKIGRLNISSFQQCWEQKDYPNALISLRWLLKNAPYASNDIYAWGPFVYYSLITTEADQAKKETLFNEMIDLFAARLNNLDAMNTWTKYKSTKGDVLSVKAEYYNWTAPGVLGANFRLNDSYDNFATAIKEVKENGGREITGSFLQTFFLVSDAMYKGTPNNGFREQYLQDYLDSKDACEKMLQMAKEASAEGDTVRAAKLLETYDAPLAAIEKIFSESGAADHDQLIAIYTKKFDTYKTDINKLNAAINLMSQNDCDDSDIYYQYSEAAYEIEPTFTSAIGLAQKAAKDGEQTKMLDYYNKALELCTSDANKGAICLNISNSLSKSKQFTGAINYAEKAKSYNEELAGKSYMKLANIYTQLGQYDKAVEFCTKASAADITVSGSANRLKDNIRRAQASKASNDKAQKEYQDYLKRKQAEEAFWNGGK